MALPKCDIELAIEATQIEDRLQYRGRVFYENEEPWRIMKLEAWENKWYENANTKYVFRYACKNLEKEGRWQRKSIDEIDKLLSANDLLD